MARFKIYVTDYDYPNIDIEKSELEPIGAEVVGLKCKDGVGLAEKAMDADALLVQYAPVTEATIAAIPNLKHIARYGIGYDNVDVNAAIARGITCTHVRDYCTEEVADHNLALVLMLARRIPMFIEETKNGKWHWSETGAPVHRLTQLTLGVIGFGRIGRAIVHRARPFGFKIISHDPFLEPQVLSKEGVEAVGFEDVVARSDILCVQCPYIEETHHLIGEKELRSMKDTAVLINCARGKIVDNKALYKALESRWISAAAMDDLEEEPPKMFGWKPSMNPLFSLNNFFVTPHVAYYTEESIEQCRHVASQDVAAVLLGKEPKYKIIL
jgi:D-3-phosphoglycerate dehydrogenase